MLEMRPSGTFGSVLFIKLTPKFQQMALKQYLEAQNTRKRKAGRHLSDRIQSLRQTLPVGWVGGSRCINIVVTVAVTAIDWLGRARDVPDVGEP